MTAGIRSADLDDLAALRIVCVRTGDNGKDATGRWSDDGLLPDVYLEPYLRYPGRLAWVVDEGAGPMGYLVAVPDTAAFVRWWQRSWTAVFVERHGSTPPAESERWLFDGGTNPERMLRGVPLGEYPAHLHIDLLPEAQGRGHGRALVRELGKALAAQQVPGVHLGVSGQNPGAVAFYDRLGFTVLRPGGDGGGLLGATAAQLTAL